MGKKDQKRSGANDGAAQQVPAVGPQDVERLAHPADVAPDLKAKVLKQVMDDNRSGPVLMPHVGQLLEEFYFG